MENELVLLVTIASMAIVSILSVFFGRFLAKKYPTSNYISFKETLDLVDIPVVTFYQGHRKLNFLLDTGSDECHINLPLLNILEHEKTNFGRNLSGLEGNKQVVNIVKMSITHAGKKFDSEFLATDLTRTFDNIKAESGVQLHGILGCSFFEKYKYVLDFEKMIFYAKK